LYGQTATLTSGWEGNEKDETFFGLEVPLALSFIFIFHSLIDLLQEIKNKFSSANLGQVKVLSVISSQESANGGVMVVVTGSWEPSNQSGKHTRRFIETFFLMRGSRQHTFYIQNDIMYILQNNPPDFSEGILQNSPSFFFFLPFSFSFTLFSIFLLFLITITSPNSASFQK
jgi:hypothetical protein